MAHRGVPGWAEMTGPQCPAVLSYWLGLSGRAWPQLRCCHRLLTPGGYQLPALLATDQQAVS